MADILKVWDEDTQQWIVIPAIQGETAEEGTGYIKFPNGTLQCFGWYTSGAVSTTAYASHYLARVDCNIVFPVAFIETPSFTLSQEGNDGMLLSYIGDETGVSRVNLIRLQSGSIYPNFGWTAIGRWK